MGAIASLITRLKIVYSTVYSDADQRKHQSSASLASVWGIHRGPVNSPHKWPVTQKMFPFDDVIMMMFHSMLLFWDSPQSSRVTGTCTTLVVCISLVLVLRDLVWKDVNWRCNNPWLVYLWGRHSKYRHKLIYDCSDRSEANMNTTYSSEARDDLELGIEGIIRLHHVCAHWHSSLVSRNMSFEQRRYVVFRQSWFVICRKRVCNIFNH